MRELTRADVLAHRRRASGLDERLPNTAESIRRAAWAGLQDSMPRAAVLSLHARVTEVGATAWAAPPLVQLWGPRYSVFAVADDDVAVFTVGRLPDAERAPRRATDTADRLAAALGDDEMDCRDVARALGVHPNALRYAAPTGRFLIRWDGARQPTIRAVAPPAVDPVTARLELVRRYLHVFGPGSIEGFAQWAGVKPREVGASFAALADELLPVRTPIGDGWMLASDEPSLGLDGAGTPTRLLPSGDAYYLLHGRARELLVADEQLRARLWTSRVWPGAVLHGGDIVGTWRRSGQTVTIDPWRPLPAPDRDAIELEAAGLPLPGSAEPIEVVWSV